MEILARSFQNSLMITVFVFVMMLLVDYFNVLTNGKMSRLVKTGRWRQYVISSFLGTTPGCLGAFLNVSFYVHGLLSFGAMVGGMIATSGDEAFIMLAMFPKQALILFGLLFIFGILLGWLSDRLATLFGIKPCKICNSQQVHDTDECTCFDKKSIVKDIAKLSPPRGLFLVVVMLILFGTLFGVIGPSSWGWKRIAFVALITITMVIGITVPEHYLRHHIWQHIVKEHLWKIFLWSLGAILLIEFGLSNWNLEEFVRNHMGIVGLLAVFLAVIPESGPHMIFVILYSKGLIPFSILLASSIVQDGHGMLPLVSYTVRDSLLIKAFNLVYGIIIGGTLYLLGL